MLKIQTVQGLSLESEISIVKCSMTPTEETMKLVALIRAFHPLFLESYKIENDTLILKTQIPSLWREIVLTLEELSQGKIEFEKAKKYILEEVIKQRVASMSTIPTLYSAIKLGYETTPTVMEDERYTYTKSYNRHYTLGCGKGSGIIYSISSSKDSKIAQGIQKDKWSSNLMIQRLGLPIPKWEIIDNISEIEEIWKHYEKPVVIKPTGLVGGHGVVVGIKTVDEAKKAYKFAQDASKGKVGKEWQQKVMIQEQIKGEDYRLLVIDGQLEITTKRIPAHIIGDGEKTLEQLIEITNQDPRRDITSPVHTLKPIEIDQPLLDYIKEQGLTLKTVPVKDEKIQVRKVASMSQGGITEDFTDKVGPEIKFIVESIASSIHAFTLGVDVMCQDISKPLTKENGAILEINTMPEAYLNFYPVIGESREYVTDTFVKKLLKDNNTKKVVVVGYSQDDVPTTLRKKHWIKNEDVVGEYKDGEIRINSLKINDGLVKWKAIEGLKVNASLDTIVIHHRDWEDVKENGLGFNNIDILMIKKSLTKDLQLMLKLRRYQFKGLINKIKFF